jgi:signal transduction histidine kinase/DNA-binding response OmpR family regulator/serine phosphatase RsbU (regulator of sigma subunit)
VALVPDELFSSDGSIGRDLARVDWRFTPLGLPDMWPQSLSSVVSTVLRSRFSMWMAWGPDLTFFCNEAYRRDTLDKKYPWALGRPAREVWSEIWGDIGPRIERVMSTGEASWDEGLLLFLQRSGYREETYHTFSYSPLAAEDGSIAGMLCVVIEETERVIGARRMATLRRLGAEALPTGDDLQGLGAIARDLSGNPQDLPFALIYTLDEDGFTAHLAGSCGLQPGHPAAPATFDITDGAAPWPLGPTRDGHAVEVDDLADRFAGLPTGVWEDPPRRAMVLPLALPGWASPAAFLVAAQNPYRALDDGYRSFFELVASQVASRLSTARAYAAERDRAEQLAELDRAKTAFFTNVSHEFRTPLTLLLGPLSDALADGGAPLPPAQRQRLEVMERNAERLLSLVNALLDFSRLESGRIEPRFEATDLPRLTSELASVFASAAERAGLVFRVDCPPLDEPVWIDQDLWAKIVLNLLSNALKFTREGTIEVCLRAGEASGPASSGFVELVVSDTGIGIATEDQARLFERFYRAAAPWARTHEGSGIGLALVAELAEVHGGSVKVSSTAGEGSRFTVRLPRGRNHLPVDRQALPPGFIPLEQPPATETQPGRSMGRADATTRLVAQAAHWLEGESYVPARAHVDDPRPTVLVVDDSADMRSYIARLLTQEYAIATAGDGEEGLALAKDTLPDLVVSDIMMPRLDGFGLLAALRADPSTSHIPVVLLSARAGQEATVEGLEAGADDYLIKPFAARELLARVRANLELDRSRRIRASLERSRTLLDQAQRIAKVGSWELDLATGSVEASDELLRQLQLTDAELGSLGFEAALVARIHPADRQLLRDAIAEAEATGESLDCEVRVVTPDGQERIYRTMADVVVDEKGVRLRGANQDITDERAAQQAITAAVAAREVAAREHRIADDLQRSLVPKPSFAPDGLSIATYYRAGVEGTQVGGDWYDVVDVGAGRTALILGDVMGRGVQAAAVMGQLRAAMRAYAQLDLPPADVLALIDTAVRNLGEDQIVTAVYAVYDPDDRTLTYANAGHLPPILLRPGSAPALLREAAGPPLGVGPLTVDAAQIPFPSDSTLLLYTDGLVERRGSDLDSGISHLVECLTSAEGPLSGLPTDLVEAMLPDGPDDDVAVLVAKSGDGAADRHETAFVVPTTGPGVSSSRATLRATLRDWGVDAEDIETATLVATELITNAVIHGEAPVDVRLRKTGDSIILQVFDRTSSLPKKRRPSGDAEHGRGLTIVEGLAQRSGVRPTTTGKAVWAQLPARR